MAKTPKGLEGVSVIDIPEVGDVVPEAPEAAPEVPKGEAPAFDPKNPLPYFQFHDPKVKSYREIGGGTFEVFYG